MQWWKRLLLGLTPAALISISSAITYNACENRMVTDAPAPWQPPKWTFGVVWPILYVCIGVAWALRPSDSAWFALLSVLLALWLPVYNCWNKCGAAALLIGTALLSMGMSVALLRQRDTRASGALLVPLVLWLAYASSLNVYNVAK